MSGIANFDGTNSAHVLWLRESFQVMEKLSDPTHKGDIVSFFKEAPFHLEIKHPLDIPMIHSFLSMAYAKSVLNPDEATFIP